MVGFDRVDFCSSFGAFCDHFFLFVCFFLSGKLIRVSWGVDQLLIRM